MQVVFQQNNNIGWKLSALIGDLFEMEQLFEVVLYKQLEIWLVESVINLFLCLRIAEHVDKPCDGYAPPFFRVLLDRKLAPQLQAKQTNNLFSNLKHQISVLRKQAKKVANRFQHVVFAEQMHLQVVLIIFQSLVLDKLFHLRQLLS